MNLNENYLELAQLTDKELAQKASSLVRLLPLAIQPGGEEFIQQSTSAPDRLPSSLVFLPVDYSFTYQEEGRVLRIQLLEMLKQNCQPDDLLVLGEIQQGPLIKDDVFMRRFQMFWRMIKLGFGTERQLAHFSRNYQYLELGYERAVYDFLSANPKQKAVASDSEWGIIASTVMEQHAPVIPIEMDTYKYLALEARTRFALNQACVSLESGQMMIYLQGFPHIYGIEEWCKRYGVYYSVEIPDILRETVIGSQDPT